MSEDSESSIKEIHCKTADDFIQRLLPLGEEWKPDSCSNLVNVPGVQNVKQVHNQLSNGNGWIYRGQWNSEWTLIPKAHRPRAFDKFGRSDPEQGESSTYKLSKYIENEVLALGDFMDVANRAGLNCEYHREVFDIIYEYQSVVEKRKTFPVKELLKYLAKAQHHGIPTRLLDFTYNPLHAAYFAACDIRKKLAENKKNIAIWAFHLGDLLISHRSPESSNLRLIPVSYDGYEYIKNQKGLLLCDSKANCHFEATGIWRSFEEAVDKEHLIKKITLPQNEAKELLKLIYDQFINPVSLMPTLDKATETIKYYHWLLSDA